jgi:hypothetical protein
MLCTFFLAILLFLYGNHTCCAVTRIFPQKTLFFLRRLFKIIMLSNNAAVVYTKLKQTSKQDRSFLLLHDGTYIDVRQEEKEGESKFHAHVAFRLIYPKKMP